MKRLIANISGDIIGTGYSEIVATLAGTLDIKGYIEILSDGRAFVIAEGEKKDLEIFASAICIDNQRITVKKILADYRDPTGEFQNFRDISPKKDETDELQASASMTEARDLALAPYKMEKPSLELCSPHNGFSGIGIDLEQPDRSIDAAVEEWRPDEERCRLQPEKQEKLSLNK
jgi:acylphosphatase